MSEVSSTSSPTSGANQGVAPKKSQEGDGRKGPADLFSNLLSLASAAPAPADPDALAQQADDPAADASTGDDAPTDAASAGNPLTGLLGWIDQIMDRRFQPAGPGQIPSPDAPQGLKPATGPAQALAQGLPPGDGQGVDITGMSPVDGEATLALPDELAAGNDHASRAPALADGASTQARQARPSDTSWVKTRTLTTQTSTIQAAMMQQSETSPDHRRMPRLTSAERSTVALDERFGRQQAVAAPVLDGLSRPVTASAAGSGLGDGAPQGRAEIAAQSSGAAAADHVDAPEPFELPGAETAHDAEPVTVSHWSTQHLRHASLRVGEGSQEAIDIQLSMDGQELNVDFRTDSAEARATLTQQADQSLGAMLERSGIQLGGVSVGAQHHSGHQSHPAPGSASSPSARAASGQDSGSPAAGAAPRDRLAARQDSNRPLDLFV